ncbi:diphosphoinositol polyphosphate phosphohydrolase 2 [Crotalus adamanteus]|uniref:Diphosphoinositol polyphosphate phosphohydrolase 2 n=1 Tax=Crotalus adamanteus TaxID=8729 RepID=A0AAW1BDC9_CROAD
MMKFKPNQTRTYDREGFKKRAACLCFRSEREDEVRAGFWKAAACGLEENESNRGYRSRGCRAQTRSLLPSFPPSPPAINPFGSFVCGVCRKDLACRPLASPVGPCPAPSPAWLTGSQDLAAWKIIFSRDQPNSRFWNAGTAGRQWASAEALRGQR